MLSNEMFYFFALNSCASKEIDLATGQLTKYSC